MLLECGPRYGYHPEPKKSFLIVSEYFVAEATALFVDLVVNVFTGKRFLGGYFGEGVTDFVKEKVSNWVNYIEKFSMVAKTQPQAAVSRSLQFEWNYILRVVPHCGNLFVSLRYAINNVFWPSLFGDVVTDTGKSIFSLPARLDGLGIRDPVVSGELVFHASRSGTDHIIRAMRGDKVFSLVDHLLLLSESRFVIRREQEQVDKLQFDSALQPMNERLQRIILRGY